MKIKTGKVGEITFDSECLKRGFNVYKPMTEDSKVDSIIEKNNIYIKVQIKTLQNGVLPVRKLSHSKTEHKVFLYTKNEIDFFIGIDIINGDCYILPIEESSKFTSSIGKRKLEKFKNNFDLLELYIRNNINGELKFGETLTSNVDGNTEPSL